MKYKAMQKKLNLTDENLSDIKKAIEDAEKKSDGEIAVAITAESDDYSYWELVTAVLISALVSIILLPFSGKIKNSLLLSYWNTMPDWTLPVIFVVAIFASLIISFHLLNIPVLDRLIIPNQIKKSRVTNRAFRYFTESGIYKTSNHSGILIFVSFLERQVRIIADEGISNKISQDLWNLIADELAENIRKGNTAEGLTTAITKCSELLEEYFPCNSKKENQIKDEPVILEDK